MTTLQLNLPTETYKIYIGQGIINNVADYFNVNRKVFILTDSGVPKEYANKVKEQCKEAIIYTVPKGESSKSFAVMEKVCEAMMNFGMSRADCAIAVGGGVVGDLMGFSASAYMRGIDFYNIPTTLLSQVDSSIGGKTAINLGNVKNIVGAFHQPKGVLIDTDVLKTLSKRHFSAGLAEAVKMSLTSDKELFEFFEKNEVNEKTIETIIVKSLQIKQYVVEQDEKESGLRKILNFGHTFGHGIEAESELFDLYHGECVALGMLPMCSKEVKDRLLPILKKLELPTEYKGNVDKALEYACHDKKASGGGVSVIFVEKVGECKIEKMTLEKFAEHIHSFYNEKD